MKKQPLKSGDIKLDDELDLSSGDFDFNFDDPGLDKKRTPASPVKDGAKEAIKFHFSQDRNIRNYIGKALPKEYADVFDAYTSVRDEASGALGDIKKITQRPVNDFAKLINEKVASKHKRTKKALAWLIDQTDEYKQEKFDQRKADEDAINVGLGELQNTLAQSFAKQEQAEEERRAEDKDRRNLEMAQEAVAQARQIKLLNTIARSSDILAKTEMGFNLAEKKKSLELRYRIAFGIRDLVVGQKELTEVTRAHLKAIQHNTGLPEAQKLLMSERFKNTVQNKFVNGTLGQFGPEGFAGKALKNFREKAVQTAQDVADGIGMAHSAVDTLTQDDLDFDDLSPEEKARKKRARMITGAAMDYVGPKAVGKVSEWARKRLPGLEKKVNRGASKLGYGAQNLDSIAKDFAYGGDASENWAKQGLRTLTEMLLPGRDKDNKLRMASGDALFEPGANGSQATTRALVEVIPGLLARILQEQQIQRTGNTKQGLAHFDYKSGVFRYSSDMKNKIEGSIVKNSTSDLVLDSLVNTLKQSGADLDKNDASQLKRFLMTSRMSGSTITPERLMDPSFFKGVKGQGTDERLAGAFKKHFSSSDGKFTDSDENLKKRYEVFSNINTAVRNASDPRAVIQQAVSEGHTELLREMGWINADGSINLERAYTNGIGDSEGSYADTSVWKPAQGKASRRRGSKASFTPIGESYQTPQPKPATPEPAAQPQVDNFSKALLEKLVAGQETQSTWLEKIETNTAQPIVVGGGTGQEGEDGQGFMDRSVRGNLNKLKRKVSGAGRGFMNWLKKPHPLVVKAKDALASSWLAGARKFKDFKDGLPDLADLYVYGSDKVRITKAMLESQTLVDAKGKVIASIKDLAESVGDIKNQAGEVILTEGEKLSSYLKADGITFTKVWYSRVKSALSKGFSAGNALRKKISSLAGGMFNTASSLAGVAKNVALEFIQPAQDVYVTGEQEPRLRAFMMRQGGYFDKKTGDVINRPTDIKGPVVNADNELLLSNEDLKKGIVDAAGKPFKTIMQKAVDKVRTNIANTRKAIGMALNFGKKVAGSAIGAAKGLMKGIGKFMNFGMSAFKGSDVKGMAEAAAQSPENAASLNITLLTQIRDILAERLPEKDSGSKATLSSMFSGGSVDPQPSGGGGGAVPPEGPETNVVNGSGGAGSLLGVLQSGVGMAKAAAGKAASVAGSLLKGRKGVLGKLGGFLSKATEGGEEQPAAKPAEQAQAAPQEKQSRMAALRERVAAAKDKMRIGGGKATLNDINGDGVRENSVIDKLRNKTNKNDASNARGGNREVQKLDTENAVDFVMGKLTDAFATQQQRCCCEGGAADLLGMGGDETDRARGGPRGKGPRGKGPRGKGPRGKVGNGVLRKTVELGKRGAVQAGKWALTRALPFIATRAIPAIVGAIGTVLGSPVIAGVAAAAAVGGLAWWGYKTFYKDNKDVKLKDAASLNSIRMAEYGFGLDDTTQYGRLAQLEKVLEPAVIKNDKGAELDKSKISAQDVLSIFGVTEEEPTRVKALLTWLERRFKPTYLKWQAIAKAIDKPLEKLDSEDKTIKLKILQAIEGNNTGWDERGNPFGSDSDLTMGPKEIKELISAAKKLLEVESKRGDKPDAQKLASEVAEAGATGAAAKGIVDGAVSGKITPDGKPYKGGATLADKLGASAEDKAIVNAAFKTGGLEALPGQRLDALTSIKLRAYGVAEPTAGTLSAINALEKAAAPFITVDKNGSSSANLDVEKLFAAAGKYFGVSKSNSSAYSAWTEWVMKRFMPVFTTFRANLLFHTGITDAALAHRSLTAAQTAAIAHQLVAVPDIWQTSLSGWPGKPGLADAASCDPFVKHLDEAAKKAVLQEIQAPKAPSPSESNAKGYAEQRYDGMPTPEKPKEKNPYLQNAMFKPPAPPDAEVEPKSGSTGGGSPKSSGGSVGSIPIAAGDLASGNAADQFIKLRKGAKLEGMNPEMLKLFRGMAEEYGTLTGKQIPVNSGARDFDQQMALYQANPSKAAKPGGSLHEKGLALDIDTATANELERLGLMRKYGFTRPVGGETWHIEPAGIQPAISQAKNDPSFATQAILKSPGIGGGGAGMTKTAFALGRRSTEIAMASMNASGSEIKPDSPEVQTAASSAGNAGTPRGAAVLGGMPTNTGSGYAASVQASKDNQSSSSALTSGSGVGAGAYAAMPEPGDRQANMVLVKEAAKAVGVDPNVALTTTALESSFKSNAAAGTSSAKGLNQFTSGTWSDMMKKHGKDLGIPPDASPNDPKANALLGAQFLKTNLKIAEKRGLPTDIVQGYLMHFLGAGGANTFNKLADNDIVAQAMPQAASANKPTFYDQSGKARTKAEMLAFITNKINKAAKDFGIDLGSAAPSAGYSAGPQMASNAPTGPSSGSGATSLSSGASRLPTPDYSQSYRPPSPSLATQGMAAAPSSSPQTQSFDKLTEAIVQGQDIQQKQLTALNGILNAVQVMAEHLANKKLNENSPQPPTKEPAPERLAPGSTVRQVAKPLVTA